ncbi:MAG: 4Fe-4S dicluster domain-containing protein [bacterium]|nr:4Fe-4S dicluster domain-containing protein [bacterium]
MACKDCVSVCPLSCLVADKTDVDSYQKAYPRLGTHSECNGCNICAKDCPVDAINMVSTKALDAA